MEMGSLEKTVLNSDGSCSDTTLKDHWLNVLKCVYNCVVERQIFSTCNKKLQVSLKLVVNQMLIIL